MSDHDHHPFPEGGGELIWIRLRISPIHHNFPRIERKASIQKRRRAFQRKAVYDHDHHPFHFPSRGKALRKECCVLSVSLSVCLFVIMTMTTTLSLSQKRKRALQKKALCDHDPTPFLSLKKRTFEKKALYDCMTMTTTPSLSKKRRRALERKAVSDHGHHPFPFPKEEESLCE